MTSRASSDHFVSLFPLQSFHRSSSSSPSLRSPGLPSSFGTLSAQMRRTSSASWPAALPRLQASLSSQGIKATKEAMTRKRPTIISMEKMPRSRALLKPARKPAGVAEAGKAVQTRSASRCWIRRHQCGNSVVAKPTGVASPLVGLVLLHRQTRPAQCQRTPRCSLPLPLGKPSPLLRPPGCPSAI